MAEERGDVRLPDVDSVRSIAKLARQRTTMSEYAPVTAPKVVVSELPAAATRRCRLPSGRLRSIVSHRFFERAVLAVISANCVSLALRDSTASACGYSLDPSVDRALFGLDVAFTTIFNLEMVLKLAAFGVLRGADAYLRSGWNVIDGTVTIIALLGLLPGLCVSLSGLSALRAVRILRALRSFPQLRALAASVKALIASTPKLVHVGSLVIFFLMAFGVLGVQVCGRADEA